MEREEFLIAQRKLTKICLDVLSDYGFVLAGSGAIREHHLIDRPTQDIDMFTVQNKQHLFTEAVSTLSAHLDREGYTVKVERRYETFATLKVSTSTIVLSVDLGIDARTWRPVEKEIGPTLAIEEAVGSKIAALFSRGEARDFLDADSIRQAGIYTDEQLIALAKDNDPGFLTDMFAERLLQINDLDYPVFKEYGITNSQLSAIKKRLTGWAHGIRSSSEKSKAPDQEPWEITAIKYSSYLVTPSDGQALPSRNYYEYDYPSSGTPDDTGLSR